MVCQNKIKEIQYCNFSSDCFFKLSKYLAGTWQHGIQSAAEQTAKVDKLGEKWFCSGSRQLLSVFWRGQVLHLIAITLYAYCLPTRLSFLSLFYGDSVKWRLHFTVCLSWKIVMNFPHFQSGWERECLNGVRTPPCPWSAPSLLVSSW